MRLDYSWTWCIREELIKGIIQVCIFFVMWASKPCFLSLWHHCCSFLKPSTLDASVTSCSMLGYGSWRGWSVQKSSVFPRYWTDLAFISTYRSCLPEYKHCPKLFGCVVNWAAFKSLSQRPGYSKDPPCKIIARYSLTVSFCFRLIAK